MVSVVQQNPLPPLVCFLVASSPAVCQYEAFSSSFLPTWYLASGSFESAAVSFRDG